MPFRRTCDVVDKDVYVTAWKTFKEMTRKKKREHEETMRNQLVNRSTNAKTFWTLVHLATP